jgi:protocatechuate 4,5-dioxygenase, alpha chain
MLIIGNVIAGTRLPRARGIERRAFVRDSAHLQSVIIARHMVWKKHDYDSIPGTYVFDGKKSHSAYGLNKLLFSFNKEENRQEFAANPAAYADKFRLTPPQKLALVSDDFLGLIRQGANIYYLAKLAVPRGFSVQDAGAAFQGITTEEFKAKLESKGEGLIDKLKERGYWNG